jgi:hypothetical protein
MGLLNRDYAGLTPAERLAHARLVPAESLWFAIMSWVLAVVLVVVVIGGIGIGISVIAAHLW